MRIEGSKGEGCILFIFNMDHGVRYKAGIVMI